MRRLFDTADQQGPRRVRGPDQPPRAGRVSRLGPLHVRGPNLIRSGFAVAGVDFDQWKALTAVLLKLDVRLSSLGRSSFGREGSVAARLFAQFMFYTLVGAAMAAFVWFSRDLFLAGTISMTYLMFMVGTAVLLDHNSAIASPTDYAILGFRPIASRTYFAVRLTNVLVYTTVMTTVAAWLPAGSLFLRHGAAVGAAGLVAFYACSTSTTLALLFGYTWILRLVGPDAIARALSYVQMVMSFGVYGGYFLMARILSKNFIESFTLPKTKWMMLYPGSWFASYLELAAGTIGWTEIVPAAASLVALAAMVSGLGGRLSLDYSERLGAMAAATARAKPTKKIRAKMGVWFTSGEARAVALLVGSQFRHDQKFRMGVLGILPMTLIYLLMGVRDGAVADPFIAPRGRQGFSLVSMAVMMFPSILKMHFTRSDAFRASWIFFACPCDRMKIVRSSKNVLVAFFLVPYMLFVAAVFAYFAGNVWHVMVHVGVIGLLSHLVLQVAVLADPELPFSRPMQKMRSSTALFGLMMAMSMVSGFFSVFSARLYGSIVATLVAFVTILVASAAVDRLTSARVARQAARLEFEG